MKIELTQKRINQALTKTFILLCVFMFFGLFALMTFWPKQELDGRSLVPSLAWNALEGNLQAVIALLDQGFEIERPAPRTPLTAAAEGGHLEVARLLLERGAGVGSADKNGARPITVAARYGHEDIVSLFISVGAGVNVLDGSMLSALHWASREGYLGIVKLLLESGADVNITGLEGGTPLMAAAGLNHTNIVEYLLLSGADKELKNIHGERAIDLAKKEKNNSVIKMLN